MKEENNVSKKGWKRIVGKKWFFPAVYLTMAALLLTGVLWYQNLDNQVPEANEQPDTDLSNDELTSFDEDFNEESQPVIDQQEVVKMPVPNQDEAEIVTKFYDYEADEEDQVNALVLYNNKYYQSKGVDITYSDGEAFDVTAALSGTVTEVKEHPLLGNVIQLSHENDVTTYYASLENVLVETGAEVKQGDTIGTAGRNLYGQASGTHVHFELRKNGEPVNPEDYFNQQIGDIESPQHREDNEPSDGSESDGSEVDSDMSRNDVDIDGSTGEDDETDEDSGDNESNQDQITEDAESSAALANT
ncbi:M23 family metallopeptidase [Aquibacillus albus]|uniref:Stage II sporulation protein Q n=1 Tax=Aquibacillus albus TaxID=1168171 RepID=A0ABS2MZG3_9BACI|nr:M23 family metallopeptidase [Aquibacillus albus]MBM7571299.1 stage II sporulation protein Q [Aquibacillus albus]